jgi:acyl-CoA thioesterase II
MPGLGTQPKKAHSILMADLQELLDVLDMRPTGEQSYEAGSISFGGGPTVFGGQLMAQAIVAGASVDPGKEVRSLHTVFARPAQVHLPLEISIDVLQAGRTFASASVAFRQGEKECARSMILLGSIEPDLLRHQPSPPAVIPPTDGQQVSHGPAYWEVQMEEGIDLNDPEVTGPPELTVWTRFPGASTTQTVSRALLAFATDGFLIATAMRPHPGIGQSMAHVGVATTVVTHTLAFHEDVDAAEWLTLRMASSYAGHGSSYGRGEVFDPSGLHVASFVQENMIRNVPAPKTPPA